MRFQERDGKIINSIYYLGDGVLAQRQLKEIHFSGVSLRAMQKRISKLCQQEYLKRAANNHRKIKPIPEQIYWLGWKGALWLSDCNNIKVECPENPGENQLRKLKLILKEHGIRWMREPRWSKLHHDLEVVDFHLKLKKSVFELPSINIDYWLQESEFRSDVDLIDFKFRNKDGDIIQKRRGVCPDYFFMISDEERRRFGKPHRLPLLLEMDMGTHPVSSRFGLQKAAPYASYIKDPVYKSRFGINTGIWLVVTTGERRMVNLMQQTKARVGEDAQYFLFSFINHLENVNLLTSPIWWQTDNSTPRSILSTY